MRFRITSLVVLMFCLAGCQKESGSVGVNVRSKTPVTSASADPVGGTVDTRAETGLHPEAESPVTESVSGNPSLTDRPAPAAGSLHVLTWNVESGGSNPKVIASQLGEYRGVDIAVLTEVLASEFENFRSSIHAGEGAEYASVNSQTGDDDRVEVIFNSTRLELLQSQEPNEMGGVSVNNGRHRSPVVCLFQDRASGEKFFIVAVHLARGNAEFRKQQSIGIRDWARERLEAVILIGDLNFDYVFSDDRGNEGFEELQRDNVMKWVRPIELIDSNWFDGDGDGVDDYPGSLLDGVYVSGQAKEWSPECRVLVREGDFPDNGETSDHRAITFDFVPGKSAAGN